MKKNKYFFKSFIPSAIKAWNDTTLDLKRATSLQNMKAKLSNLYKSTTLMDMEILTIVNAGSNLTRHKLTTR